MSNVKYDFIRFKEFIEFLLLSKYFERDNELSNIAGHTQFYKYLLEIL